MNFCTNCGKKIKKTDKFCTGCGGKIVSNEDKKRVDDKKNQNIILLLGIFLVLFATFALGIISWKNMGNLLRLLFFAFECILFFILSFVIKLLTGNKIHRFFFVVGMILVPYTLTLIPYYGFLTDYFNKGPGLYIYLAIIYLIIFGIYLIINKKFNSRVVDFLSLISLFISFISTALIFNNNISIIALLISIYIVALYLLSLLKIFEDSFKKMMKIFVYVLYSAFFIFAIFSLSNNKVMVDCIINIITFIIFIVIGCLITYNNEKNGFSIVTPIFNSILTIFFVFGTIDSFTKIDYKWINNDMMMVFSLSIIPFIIYFISVVMNNKLLNITTLIVTCFGEILALTISSIIEHHVLTLVITILLLLFTIFNIYIQKRKWMNYVIPFNIFFIISSICDLTFNPAFIYELLCSALAFLIIYIILKKIKSKYALTYLISSYALAMISMYNFGYEFNIINFGIIFILLLVFVLSYVYKESIGISIASFVSLNIGSILIYLNIDHTLYYGLLTISSLTIIFSLLISKLKKVDLKSYILYSEIVIFIITLTNSMRLPNYILFINVLIYVLGFIGLILYHNKKWWRLSYILLGLLTVTRIIYTIIDPIVIASIISILLILIILTIIYLLDVEKNITIAILSLILLYPYYMLIGNTFSTISQLYLIPFLVYTIVFTEIIKFKDPDAKKALTLIPISIISYFFIVLGNGVSSIIINLCVSLIYIILGLYRKYNYLLYFGVIFIIATLVIKLFTVLNSIAVVILLIVIGFVLIGISLFVEFKKKK